MFKKLFLIFIIISIVICSCSFINPKSSTYSKAEYANASIKLKEIPSYDLSVNVKSAVLMEAYSGEILYAYNEDQSYSPASVTKIMTLLIVAEAIESNVIKPDERVTVSSYAAGMGGSQIFLEEGEVMTVDDLLRSTVIASANDAAVALAELVGGNEANFVAKMNKRANELGLSNTNFENVTGLDDTTNNHVSSAKDIAIMSKELIKHDIILKYSSLWQDTIRDGQFTLTNTNRLVRYYDGCNGLKTGSTDKAGYCISTTAKRGNMQLIAVIMGANTRDERNTAAKELLDYGFAGYEIFHQTIETMGDIKVVKGKVNTVSIECLEFIMLIPKGKPIEIKKNIPEEISGGHSKGDVIGALEFYMDNELVGKSNVIVTEDVGALGYFDLFLRFILSNMGKVL